VHAPRFLATGISSGPAAVPVIDAYSYRNRLPARSAPPRIRHRNAAFDARWLLIDRIRKTISSRLRIDVTGNEYMVVHCILHLPNLLTVVAPAFYMNRKVIEALDVFDYRDPSEPLRMADFSLDAQGGDQLRYLESYLDQQAIPIDPVRCPLVPGIHEISPSPDYGVLSDVGPGIWARQFLTNTLSYDIAKSQIEWLLSASQHGAGALAFARNEIPNQDFVPLLRTSAMAGGIISKIAALDLRAKCQIDSDVEFILESGTGLGGARPKAVMLHEGRESIVKFPQLGDLFDVPRVEFATMRLAHLAQINVPDIELLELKDGAVFIAQRFDRTDSGTRIHAMTAQSLLYKSDKSDFSYGLIAESIHRLDERQTENGPELFRRMVFNIMVGNVDDHLRNQSIMVRGPASMALAPAYDVLPHPEAYTRPQSINVGDLGAASTIPNALSQCHRFCLSIKDASSVIEEIREVVLTWRSVFKDADVRAADIALLASCFNVAEA